MSWRNVLRQFTSQHQQRPKCIWSESSHHFNTTQQKRFPTFTLYALIDPMDHWQLNARTNTQGSPSPATLNDVLYTLPTKSNHNGARSLKDDTAHCFDLQQILYGVLPFCLLTHAHCMCFVKALATLTNMFDEYGADRSRRVTGYVECKGMSINYVII